MGQQIIPQGQMNGMVPNDPFMQVLDKLAQALGGMAQTQQEILNKLQTQQYMQSSGLPLVPPYPTNGIPRHQYDWLYINGLAYNFDGTRKVQQLTTADIAEHRKLLLEFMSLYGIK